MTDNYKKYAVVSYRDGGFLIAEADTLEEAHSIGKEYTANAWYEGDPYHINELTPEGFLKRRIM